MNKNVEKVNKWRKATKLRMVDAMGGKCQCCGYSACTDSLAFHHIDSDTKEFSFNRARANPKAWSKLVVELKKCILVCHNCHGEIHAGFRELPDAYESFNESYAIYQESAPEDECPMCSSMKPAKHKFCSQLCAKKNSRKVDWDNIDLLSLLQQHSISELENTLGVSSAAIYKRRNKILSIHAPLAQR